MTRKKLLLTADELKVETFATTRTETVEGTVHGMEVSGAYGPACASEPPNCNESGRFGPACQSAWPNCN